MTDAETRDRIVAVLEDADEPFSPSVIQRRLATRSRDVTTDIIRGVCRELEESGDVERTAETPLSYQISDQ